MSCIFNHATKSSSIFARDSICYRPAVRPSVRLSVYTGGSVKNGWR